MIRKYVNELILSWSKHLGQYLLMTLESGSH